MTPERANILFKELQLERQPKIRHRVWRLHDPAYHLVCGLTLPVTSLTLRHLGYIGVLSGGETVYVAATKLEYRNLY